MKKRIFLLGYLSILLFATFSFGSGLKLSQGTWSVGGRFSAPIRYDRTGFYEISLREEPEFSYFIADHVRLTGSLEIGGDLRMAQPFRISSALMTWGAKFGAEYVFDAWGDLHPFVGGRLGFRVQNAYFENMHLLVAVPLGLHYAITDSVAISFEMPIELAFSPKNGFEHIEITPGYFGITAFF